MFEKLAEMVEKIFKRLRTDCWYGKKKRKWKKLIFKMILGGGQEYESAQFKVI